MSTKAFGCWVVNVTTTPAVCGRRWDTWQFFLECSRVTACCTQILRIRVPASKYIFNVYGYVTAEPPRLSCTKPDPNRLQNQRIKRHASVMVNIIHHAAKSFITHHYCIHLLVLDVGLAEVRHRPLLVSDGSANAHPLSQGPERSERNVHRWNITSTWIFNFEDHFHVKRKSEMRLLQIKLH